MCALCTPEILNAVEKRQETKKKVFVKEIIRTNNHTKKLTNGYKVV